jgi:signal transduction histidine kinase
MNSIARIAGDNSVAPLEFMDEDAARKTLQNLNREPDIQEAVVLDKNGKLFARYARTTPGNITTLQKGRETDKQLSSKITGQKLYTQYSIYDNKEFLGTLIIKAELGDLKKITLNYVMVGALVLLAGLISALFISFFLQRTISNRLLALVSKTKEVADTGNYSLRVATEDKDEIGILSKEFNGLLVQIDNMQRSLKEANNKLEKRVQQRTAELETANKELESFSYTVSHDLKAPLRAINGFTDILVKKYNDKLDDKGKEIAGIIVANAKKMGRLIEDLLEFSRIGRKDLTLNVVSMDTIVDQVLAETKRAYEGREVTVNKEPLPEVHGDPNLLTQVWTNFISNAFKYTLHKEKAIVTIGSYPQDKEIVFFIKDNGAGFDMKYSDKLFRVFQRLHGADEFEGTGVGLAIVNRIITRHGGRVWAEGKVNEGASFYFSLPAKG